MATKRVLVTLGKRKRAVSFISDTSNKPDRDTLRKQIKEEFDDCLELVSSPDSLLVFGWGGCLVDRANIFVPPLECRSQVLVCKFGSVRCMNPWIP